MNKNENILELNELYAYVKNKPIYYKEGLLKDKIVKTIPMDEDWKERCRQNSWWFHDYEELSEKYKTEQMQKIYELKERLLSFAGESTNFCFGVPYVLQLLERGQLWYGDNLVHVNGQPRQAHVNSAIFWNKNRNKYRIATGYALTVDSMWREHSWLLQQEKNNTKVVETTPIDRVLYFGYVLTEKECYEFYNTNI